MKLSIIIPCYNVESYIRQCLDSVFFQSIDDYEIICVNDGSTDRTLDILNNYAIKYDNLKIITQKNQGASVARNAGIDLAKGDYIFFLDGDDFFMDNSSLCKILNSALQNRVDLFILNALINGDLRYIEGFPSKNLVISGIQMMKLFYQNCRTIVTPFWMHLYRRQYLIDNHLYQKENSYHEDELFSPIALYNAERVMCEDVPLVHYRWQREGAVTSHFTKKHYKDWGKIGEDLYLYFKRINAKEDEPYRQVFSVFSGLIEKLYIDGIPYKDYIGGNYVEIMRDCAKTDFDRKSYKLYKIHPSLMVRYRDNTINIILRKLINRFL